MFLFIMFNILKNRGALTFAQATFDALFMLNINVKFSEYTVIVCSNVHSVESVYYFKI